jgi:glycosyltransferase 2 family protein
LQRLRPVGAPGASDSTLELAVALGHYHGAKVFAPAGMAGGNAGSESQSWMSIGVASDLDTRRASRGGGAGKIAVFAGKLLVTGACFWYLSRQINLSQVIAAVPWLDFRWIVFAVLVVMLEVPLGGLRWCAIVDALGARDGRVTQTVMIGLTAIGVFFAQVLPSVAGDGIRAWLLARRGCDWRNAVISVVIDRAIGVGVLVAMGFVILLLPSGLTALGGYRDVVLVVYAASLLAGALGLLLAPRVAPLLARWRYSRWLAKLVVDARRVLLGPRGPLIVALGCLIHVFTIVVVWSVGRAEGLVLPVSDAAVLFTVMIGVALVPISISGWGLRELAVISLLGNHGIAPERALLFSVCFGLVLAAGSLPGAVVWLFYSFVPSWRSSEPGG